MRSIINTSNDFQMIFVWSFVTTDYTQNKPKRVPRGPQPYSFLQIVSIFIIFMNL